VLNGQNGYAGGGPPPGAIILTAEMLTRTSRKWVKLPAMSRRLQVLPVEELETLGLVPPGVDEEKLAQLRESGIWVEIGSVGALEALSMAPVIAGSETWPEDQAGRSQAFTKWRSGLSDAERMSYDELLVLGQNRYIAAGLQTPKLAPEACTMFKDDALFLMTEIQVLSGVIVRPAPLVATPEPAEAPAPVEETPAQDTTAG
jgi:hypothetical protein